MWRRQRIGTKEIPIRQGKEIEEGKPPWEGGETFECENADRLRLDLINMLVTSSSVKRGLRFLRLQ